MCPFVGVVVGVVGRVQDRKCLGTTWVPTGQKFRQKDNNSAVRRPYGPEPQQRALAPRPFWLDFREKVIFSKSHVLVRIELRGAIVEFAPKSKMAWRLLIL